MRLFGARIDRNARVSPSVSVWAPWNLEVGTDASIGHHVDVYSVAPIRIGAHATVSQYCFLCSASHDPSDPNMRLVSSPIVIKDQAWVCAGAYVLPGVTVGQGAVVGAASVVTKDVPDWCIVAGNPSRYIRERVIMRTEKPDPY